MASPLSSNRLCALPSAVKAYRLYGEHLLLQLLQLFEIQRFKILSHEMAAGITENQFCCKILFSHKVNRCSIDYGVADIADN
ncbi:hypothetical protein OsJ_06416 [Oryza sativa Japonica Group]|uniref:Uncharacterized protein n=1 Tax=Oryza sativa subsp. japonica TaxID=39947 RepID=B9F588_ORYSJ|nr:hypothetical protein OsJ_06416 [Oryza sativa Japonica Group]